MTWEWLLSQGLQLSSLFGALCLGGRQGRGHSRAVDLGVFREHAVLGARREWGGCAGTEPVDNQASVSALLLPSVTNSLAGSGVGENGVWMSLLYVPTLLVL